MKTSSKPEVYIPFKTTAKKKKHLLNNRCFLITRWPHLGSNQGLADYESATLTS